LPEAIFTFQHNKLISKSPQVYPRNFLLIHRLKEEIIAGLKSHLIAFNFFMRFKVVNEEENGELFLREQSTDMEVKTVNDCRKTIKLALKKRK